MTKINIDISRGSEQIVNLTCEPIEQVLESARLCETIRVKIENLTPSQGPVTILVRYCENANMLPIEYLEDVVSIGLATKAEFRYLKMICDILKS